MVRGAGEILKHVSDQPTKAKRIESLRQAIEAQPTLLQVIVGAYDAGVHWDILDGAVPYRKNDVPDQEYQLWRALPSLPQFCVGMPMPFAQKEKLFIQLLEKCMPMDAEMLTAMKDKQMPSYARNITIDVVRKAFPDLLPPENPQRQKVVPPVRQSRPARPPQYPTLAPGDPNMAGDPLAIYDNPRTAEIVGTQFSKVVGSGTSAVDGTNGEVDPLMIHENPNSRRR